MADGPEPGKRTRRRDDAAAGRDDAPGAWGRARPEKAAADLRIVPGPTLFTLGWASVLAGPLETDAAAPAPAPAVAA